MKSSEAPTSQMDTFDMMHKYRTVCPFTKSKWCRFICIVLFRLCNVDMYVLYNTVYTETFKTMCLYMAIPPATKKYHRTWGLLFVFSWRGTRSQQCYQGPEYCSLVSTQHLTAPAPGVALGPWGLAQASKSVPGCSRMLGQLVSSCRPITDQGMSMSCNIEANFVLTRSARSLPLEEQQLNPTQSGILSRCKPREKLLVVFDCIVFPKHL